MPSNQTSSNLWWPNIIPRPTPPPKDKAPKKGQNRPLTQNDWSVYKQNKCPVGRPREDCWNALETLEERKGERSKRSGPPCTQQGSETVLSYRMTKEKSQWGKNKRQESKTEGHTATCVSMPQHPQASGALSDRMSTRTMSNPGAHVLAEQNASLPEHLHKQKPILAEHVVGRRDGNHMDSHIHQEQKQNKKQTSDRFSPVMRTDVGESSNPSKSQWHL